MPEVRSQAREAGKQIDSRAEVPLWRDVWPLLRQTTRAWLADGCLRLGAALSYYTLFSIAPLLIVTIGIASLVFGERMAQDEVMGRIEGLVGAGPAETLQDMLERASRPRSGWLATLAGLGMTLLGASGVFGQLQRALNDIWGVPAAASRGLLALLIDRLTSFSMILVLGFVLLVSLGLGTAVTALSGLIAELFTGAHVAVRLLEVAASFGVTTLLFGMLFKLLPDARIAWSDVWVGAAFTAACFGLGRLAIGFYLGRTSAASVYGAAGSLVVLLLWVYYSSQLLFFGAEFTHVFARRRGSLAGAGEPDA